MTDLLIGVAVAGGLALFVYAIARAGRQQRGRRGEVFRAFAESRGWEYVIQGDRGLCAVLEPFEGIGSHRSPSLGEVAPQNVVVGNVEEGRAWVFWHSRRVSEGDVLQFYACLLKGPDFGADGLIVRFGEDRAVGSGVDLYYTGHRGQVDLASRTLPVFEAEAGTARRLLSGPTGHALAAAVARLPWPVDLQVRRRALSLYTTSRNLDLSRPEELALLTEVASEIARALTGEARLKG